jgi:hypothetical protein
MIDLTKARDALQIPLAFTQDFSAEVQRVLEDALELIEDLDGLELDDETAITDRPGTELRAERAQASKDLLLLVDRLTLAASLMKRDTMPAGHLELAAALVKNSYWVYKGEPDPLEQPLDVTP